MRVKCPICDSVHDLSPPILLSVCQCGSLLRGRIDVPADAPAERTSGAPVDHYVILGVDRTATAEQIKVAYRSRAKDTHPDIGGDPDEFRLVQSAYETLSNAELRHEYDSSESGTLHSSAPLVIPDLIGKRIPDASRQAVALGIAVRVAIVEAPNNSPLVGRVVGQLPYPGTAVSVNLVGLIVAVSQRSSLWERFRAAVIDLSVGFVTGLRTGLLNSQDSPKALGTASGFHQTGNAAGEVVGSLTADAVRVTATALGCIGTSFMILGLLILFSIGLAVTIALPPVGLVILALATWLTYMFVKSFQKT